MNRRERERRAQRIQKEKACPCLVGSAGMEVARGLQEGGGRRRLLEENGLEGSRWPGNVTATNGIPALLFQEPGPGC